MAQHLPSVKELYGGDAACTDGVATPQHPLGTPQPGQLVKRHETFVKAMNGAVSEGIAGDVLELPPDGGSSRPIYKSRRRYQKEISSAAGNGGLKKQHGQIMNEYLDEVLKGTGQLSKEMTLNFPLQTGFVPFDLSAPARLLYPINTPLRNQTPRIPGQGAAYRRENYRRYYWVGHWQHLVDEPRLFRESDDYTPGSGITWSGRITLRTTRTIRFRPTSRRDSPTV